LEAHRNKEDVNQVVQSKVPLSGYRLAEWLCLELVASALGTKRKIFALGAGT
jgi:hypothetical protein